jgi:formylglycine-generating enzyme required for sulfatase activity
LAACGALVIALTLLPSGNALYANSSEDQTGQRSEVAYAKNLTIQLSRDVKLEFVLIPAGRFVMGSPRDEQGHRPDETQHLVTITRPFYLGKYSITQEQYEAAIGDNPSSFSANGMEQALVQGLVTRKFPVESVTWADARAFCERLGKNDPRKRHFSLPTEAEWEYACRAGTNGPFISGADPEALVDYAWFDKNAGRRTHPVGEKKPNAWGLYDMQGNVWQWCEDTHAPFTDQPATDPLCTAVVAKREHVFRGGAWLEETREGMRIAWRCFGAEGYRSNYIGFRVVLRPR